MKELVGKLLIAPPSIKKNFFQQSVILITEHTPAGTVGVVLNNPSTVTLSTFAKENGVSAVSNDHPYIGGPVDINALTMLHTNDWRCSNTLRINSTFSISSSSEILHQLAADHMPNYWRIFVGLCRWSRNQLKYELEGIAPYDKKYSWLTASANIDIVFNQSGVDQWIEAVDLSGAEFAKSCLV